jgi:catalytic LigB subunit of aromatic ring-opening dioxygenase
MAQLVLGMALSHGPMLSTPPAMWDLRAGADRANRQHWYRGRAYDYAALAAQRGQSFERDASTEERERRHAACERALAALSRKFADARADLAIIIGNDQLEVFKEDLIAAITVYTGDAIENIALSEEQRAKLPPGIALAEQGHCPPGGAVYRGAPAEARAILRSLVEQHFDVSQSARLPKGPDRQHGIPHAFGFLYRNTMRDAPPPSIPIFVNVGVPPNQPTLRRCLDLGKALERAIAGLASDLRVALLASGGLTHFVVDEDFDRRILQAMQAGDVDLLAGLDETWFNGNTAEIKSWLPLLSAMQAQDKRMQLVDYVPCYRTEAGTGQGMAFAYWE